MSASTPTVPEQGSFARWYRTIPPQLIDAGIAAIVAAVVDVAIHVASEPGEGPADLLAYLLGATIGAVLLARRSHPLIVLLATAAVLFGYYIVGPGIAPALPLAVALYTASAAGYLWWGVGVAAFFMAAGLFIGLVKLHDPMLALLTSTVRDVALLAVLILLGDTVRSRRIRLADARAQLAEVQRNREQEAARRVAEERLRIAREVHDIIGHSISAVTLQASVATDVFDDKPDAAREALNVVVRAARNAMAELKVTVSLLRGADDEPDGRKPAPTLSDLDTLVELTRQLGLRVELTVTGNRRELPGVVELSAYRIVQEALTNVVKHAGAESVQVKIDYANAELTVEVTDDGQGPIADGTGPPGYGTVGMTERVTALGGRIEVGRCPGGGFRVHARMPIEPEAVAPAAQ